MEFDTVEFLARFIESLFLQKKNGTVQKAMLEYLEFRSRLKPNRIVQP